MKSIKHSININREKNVEEKKELALPVHEKP